MIARTGAVAAALLALAAVLAACGNTASAGDAAVIGGSRITTDDLAATVAEVQEALGTTPGAADSGLVVDILQREIITELVAQSAQREGITITQGQIDAKRAEAAAGVGGEDQLELAFLNSNVPPSQVDEQIALSIEVEALGATLAPGGPVEQQQGAVYAYVVGLSEELGVLVSPRFGTWSNVELQIGPVPTDLATPAQPQEDLGELPVPQG
ncbi:MAG: hypothetical protein ACKOT0_05345 [bacterium]